MKNLVRGGIILSVLGLCVVFIYAQTRTEYVPVIANDSQLQFNNLNNKSEIENIAIEEQNKEQGQDKKKLVEKTGSSKAVNKGSFTATAYCLRGKTAMGHGVRRGLIAADPRVLRLGSRINLGAGAYSGQYLVSDTGGKIKGRRIDIWMSSCSEARRFGRRTVTVSAL